MKYDICIERFEGAGNFPVFTLGISSEMSCFGIFELAGNEIVFENFRVFQNLFSVTGEQKINSIDCFCLSNDERLLEDCKNHHKR